MNPVWHLSFHVVFEPDLKYGTGLSSQGICDLRNKTTAIFPQKMVVAGLSSLSDNLYFI